MWRLFWSICGWACSKRSYYPITFKLYRSALYSTQINGAFIATYCYVTTEKHRQYAVIPLFFIAIIRQERRPRNKSPWNEKRTVRPIRAYVGGRTHFDRHRMLKGWLVQNSKWSKRKFSLPGDLIDTCNKIQLLSRILVSKKPIKLHLKKNPFFVVLFSAMTR